MSKSWKKKLEGEIKRVKGEGNLSLHIFSGAAGKLNRISDTKKIYTNLSSSVDDPKAKFRLNLLESRVNLHELVHSLDVANFSWMRIITAIKHLREDIMSVAFEKRKDRLERGPTLYVPTPLRNSNLGELLPSDEAELLERAVKLSRVEEKMLERAHQVMEAHALFRSRYLQSKMLEGAGGFLFNEVYFDLFPDPGEGQALDNTTVIPHLPPAEYRRAGMYEYISNLYRKKVGAEGLDREEVKEALDWVDEKEKEIVENKDLYKKAVEVKENIQKIFEKGLITAIMELSMAQELPDIEFFLSSDLKKIEKWISSDNPEKRVQTITRIEEDEVPTDINNSKDLENYFNERFGWNINSEKEILKFHSQVLNKTQLRVKDREGILDKWKDVLKEKKKAAGMVEGLKARGLERQAFMFRITKDFEDEVDHIEIGPMFFSGGSEDPRDKLGNYFFPYLFRKIIDKNVADIKCPLTEYSPYCNRFSEDEETCKQKWKTNFREYFMEKVLPLACFEKCMFESVTKIFI